MIDLRDKIVIKVTKEMTGIKVGYVTQFLHLKQSGLSGQGSHLR